MNDPLGTKLYYSISEVSKLTELQPYTLRAWEKEFPWLRPRRARGKNRAYRERDIGIILLIKKLLYEERYTTQGVKKKLKAEPNLLHQAGPQISHLLTGAERPEIAKKRDLTPEPKLVKAKGQTEIKTVVEDLKKELKEILELI